MEEFIMKKFFIILGIAVINFSLLSSCSMQKMIQDDEGLKIGLSISTFDDPSLIHIKEGIHHYEKSIEDKIRLIEADAKRDAARQLKQVQQFIEQGIDGIVVVPVDAEDTLPITMACQQAHIPLVYVYRLPKNLPQNITFIGSNPIEAGILQMEYIAERMDGKGNIILLLDQLNRETNDQVTQGVKKVIQEKYPYIKMIREESVLGSRAKGMERMQRWMESREKIDAVVSNSDVLALGIIQALDVAGKQEQVLIGSNGAIPDALTAIEKGTLSCTIFQDVEKQGRIALQAVLTKIQGGTVKSRIWTPIELVTSKNYKQFEKLGTNR